MKLKENLNKNVLLKIQKLFYKILLFLILKFIILFKLIIIFI